jgi:flagellar assembly protein FliH
MARDEFRTILTYGDAILTVKSDESLKAGDCLIETPNGSVDARLATRMELLKQAVRDVML